MKNAVEILRARGVGLSLTSGGALSVTCKRPLTSEQKRWLSGHKADLLAELQVQKTTMAVLIREAEVRGWEAEILRRRPNLSFNHHADLKDEVPPLPREIRFELVEERGFPQRVVDKMSHGEAAFFLFRCGGAGWR